MLRNEKYHEDDHAGRLGRAVELTMAACMVTCSLVPFAGIPKGPRVKLLYALRTYRHPPKSGDIMAMKLFLSSLGLERYCKAFEEEEVDMSAIDVMEEPDYAELGVAKVSAQGMA